MPDLRVVAVTISPLLRDVVMTLLAGYATMELVDVFDARTEIEKRLESIDPDLILIGLQPGESDEIASTLLTQLPSARAVAFSHDGRNVYVHEMRRHRAILLDASPQAVAEAILGTVTEWKV